MNRGVRKNVRFSKVAISLKRSEIEPRLLLDEMKIIDLG